MYLFVYEKKTVKWILDLLFDIHTDLALVIAWSELYYLIPIHTVLSARCPRTPTKALACSWCQVFAIVFVSLAWVEQWIRTLHDYAVWHSHWYSSWLSCCIWIATIDSDSGTLYFQQILLKTAYSSLLRRSLRSHTVWVDFPIAWLITYFCYIHTYCTYCIVHIVHIFLYRTAELAWVAWPWKYRRNYHPSLKMHYGVGGCTMYEEEIPL